MSPAIRRARERMPLSARAWRTSSAQSALRASRCDTSLAEPKATQRCTLKRCSNCNGIPMKGHPWTQLVCTVPSPP